jgi:hypothetical protein
MNIMRALSLEMDDSIFVETEAILQILQTHRNRYINEAILHYNETQRRKILAGKLMKESDLVKVDSLQTLNDFEDLDWPE